jgi:hypothetical protein
VYWLLSVSWLVILGSLLPVFRYVMFCSWCLETVPLPLLNLSFAISVPQRRVGRSASL